MDPFEHLESMINRDTATRGELLAPHAAGGLGRAARLLTGARSFAVVTGFSVPTSAGFRPETDGPPGACALAAYAACTERDVIILTDDPNAAVCQAAIEPYLDLTPTQIEVVSCGNDIRPVAGRIRAAEVEALLFVERVGPNAEGNYLSMRGVDISAVTAPFERLISDVPLTVGIGDGGNEIGMGSLPSTALGLIERGPEIHCRTATDELIVAGTSNWGAWALIVALAVLAPDSMATAEECLSQDRFAKCLKAMVGEGAVDGVEGRSIEAVDGLDLSAHTQLLASLSASLVQP